MPPPQEYSVQLQLALSVRKVQAESRPCSNPNNQCPIQSSIRSRPAKSFSYRKRACAGVPFYPSHFVFLSVRAVALGESNRAENRHIPRGTNAFIARSGRVGIPAKAVCQYSRAK